MCRAVTCRTCGGTTWAGCGQHIADVKRSVPAGQWCAGHSTTSTRSKATTASEPRPGGLLSRFFGR